MLLVLVVVVAGLVVLCSNVRVVRGMVQHVVLSGLIRVQERHCLRFRV